MSRNIQLMRNVSLGNTEAKRSGSERVCPYGISCMSGEMAHPWSDAWRLCPLAWQR